MVPAKEPAASLRTITPTLLQTTGLTKSWAVSTPQRTRWHPWQESLLTTDDAALKRR